MFYANVGISSVARVISRISRERHAKCVMLTQSSGLAASTRRVLTAPRPLCLTHAAESPGRRCIWGLAAPKKEWLCNEGRCSASPYSIRFPTEVHAALLGATPFQHRAGSGALPVRGAVPGPLRRDWFPPMAAYACPAPPKCSLARRVVLGEAQRSILKQRRRLHTLTVSGIASARKEV